MIVYSAVVLDGRHYPIRYTEEIVEKGHGFWLVIKPAESRESFKGSVEILLSNKKRLPERAPTIIKCKREFDIISKDKPAQLFLGSKAFLSSFMVIKKLLYFLNLLS